MPLSFNNNMLFQQGGGVFKDSPEDGNVQYWDGSKWVSGDPVDINAVQGTVALWQTNSATGGGIVTPQYLNDGNTGNSTHAVTDATWTVAFPTTVRLKRFRQFGHTSNAGDGTTIEIQYYNLTTGTWTVWTTGVAARETGDWSDYTTLSAITTNSIKVIGSTNNLYLGELEVLY